MQDGDHIQNTSIGSKPNRLERDRNGNIRVLVVGNSGTGKSTMASKLAGILSVPVAHLDELYWKPNFAETPDDEFRQSVASFIRQNENWVIDGNYTRVVGGLTTSNATNILWLDPPFALYFPRLILRTCLRLLRLNPPCSLGCDESISEVLTWGPKSILWWSWNHHTPQQTFYTGEMTKAEPGDAKKWIRLGGWGSEVQALLDRAKDLVRR